MTFRMTMAAALLLGASSGAAFAQASDAKKLAPTRNEPGSSEGMLPADRAKPQNEPGSSEGRSARGSKSNAEAQRMKMKETKTKSPSTPPAR